MGIGPATVSSVKQQVIYCVTCPLSNEEFKVTYESETHDTFATVTFDSCCVQVSELDRLIEQFIQIRDDVKGFISEDASKP